MKFEIKNEEYRQVKPTPTFSGCYDTIEITRAKTTAALRDLEK